MTHQDSNPFVNMQLTAPSAQRADYDRYCQAGGRTTPNQSPFPRKVDLWFTGFSLAARKNLEPVDLKKQETVDIINGAIFNTDGWQAQAIMLVAIAIDGNLEIVQEPRRMMDIANALAAAGVPYVVEMLREGNQPPIWNLSDALDDLLCSEDSVKDPPDDSRLVAVLSGA